MRQYLELLERVLTKGDQRMDRTGVGTRAVFGHQMRFDLSEGFPLLTTKKLHTKSIFHELLWFLAGDTNIACLKENGVSIWDAWAERSTSSSLDGAMSTNTTVASSKLRPFSRSSCPRAM